MEHAAHAPAERVIDELVLLDAVLASKLRGCDLGGPMVIIARQIGQFDHSAGKPGGDGLRNFVSAHWHLA